MSLIYILISQYFLEGDLLKNPESSETDVFEVSANHWRKAEWMLMSFVKYSPYPLSHRTLLILSALTQCFLKTCLASNKNDKKQLQVFSVDNKMLLT